MVSKNNSKTKKVIRLLQRITFFYTTILISLSSTAQTYYFDYYGVKEGLPQSKIYNVVQDSKGYVWLASESGISKFDGVNFHNYTSEDGIAEGGIKTLLKDINGFIWMGHNTGGVSFFNGKEFKIHPISEQISVEVTSFLMDRDSILWITTLGDGLIKLENPYETDSGKIVFEQFKGKQLGDRVFSGTIAKGDSIFFITEAGIKKYNKSQNSFERYAPKGLSSYFQITKMYEDKAGDIWFGTFHGGLFRLIKEKNEFIVYDAKRDGLADNWISTITEDSQGNVWVGTWGGGISKFSRTEIKTFNNLNGLSDLKIRHILEDLEGNILIGTNEHGLAVFKGERFKTYTTKDGLIDQNIWAITQDKGGKYWFGTNKGISILNPKAGRKGIRFAHYNEESNSIGNHVRFLKKDRNNNIWIGTDDNAVNMYNYKTGRFESNLVINRYFSTNYSVTAMDVDKQNQLWIGTLDGLIFYDINENKSQSLSQINGLNGSDISAIFADSKGRVWVGINNGKGLNLIQDFDISKIEINEKITVKCMIDDSNGNIWIGTQAKGVFVFDGNQVIRRYMENDGLLSNLINQLNVDDNNNIYVGTSRGLNKIDSKGNIRVYTEKSGFIGIEAKENASFKDNEGNLWFGTVKGVTKYTPKLDNSIWRQPLTHIAKLRVNRIYQELVQHQKYSYLENDFTFDYNSICLNNPDAVSYQIRLDPADKDWRPITKRTIETYSSLAPGKYTFNVKAKNSAGVWNKEPITYSFTIRPPFYKAWWFILSVIVLIMIAIISYIKVREKNLIKEKKILEDKVEERTAEVVQKSLEIEKKNKDITDSIRYAKRIQTAILPPEIPFDDTFIFFRPKDIVSGDFYWLETIENKEMIAAVDCTGHGVPGAFLSILGHSMLTKIVREYGILEPAKILDQLDLEIINALHQKNVKGERVVNDGMDLALMCYNKDTQILEYSGGFNPLIRIRKGELEEIKADRFPIGMTTVHDNKKFTNHEIKVEKGDSFFIFSDGYADQFGGPDGRKYRKKHMKDLLLSIQELPMKKQGEELEKTILDWMKNHEQIDDIVFIGRRF